MPITLTVSFVKVKLILMGEVHSCHWKTNEGSVIGLLNPRALSNSDSAHAKVGQALVLDGTPTPHPPSDAVCAA
jgi:hypothetical protein